jgi:PPK2 family polyphosphate:nucleotide phosphotransferase
VNFPDSPYRVPFDGSFVMADSAREPGETALRRKTLDKQLSRSVKRISELQQTLFADDRYALLLVFQAMDAAGKDGTIRAVMSGVNPAGCQVYSFKSPSDEELEHDWLWRTTRRLPERGRIGVFNRSYYEELLAVRVHPEYLANQRLPQSDHDGLWQERFESIRDHEKHLSRNGTVVLKFFLNVSKDEQKARFLKRLTTPEKYWKFARSDLATRDRWDDYMQAYESMLNQTSTACAPWFAIPADDKRYMRSCVAKIIEQTLESLPLRYPQKTDDEIALFEEHIARLKSEAA